MKAHLRQRGCLHRNGGNNLASQLYIGNALVALKRNKLYVNIDLFDIAAFHSKYKKSERNNVLVTGLC